MVPIRVFVPPGQSVHVDRLGAQAHPHVPVPPLAHYLHLEVVDAAGGGDRVRGSDAACILND